MMSSIFADQISDFVDLEDERELALWKHFWFLFPGSVFDRKILPCHDFPYEEEPIFIDGFGDLVPENWQVIYPEIFWIYVDHHPVPEGKDLGGEEIPLAINITVDVITIFILMWYRFCPAFWGWTGTQAVLGITAEICSWLILEASRLGAGRKR